MRSSSTLSYTEALVSDIGLGHLSMATVLNEVFLENHFEVKFPFSLLSPLSTWSP
jgi:hypothetical protein